MLTESDQQDLQYAKFLLEDPGFATKVMNVLGLPFEKGFQYLPAKWAEQIRMISTKALGGALEFAVLTLAGSQGKPSSELWHKIVAAASGGAGGFFGIAALGAELSVSTTIILRSIADIARSEGEDIKDIQVKMACLEVFALGGKSSGSNSEYFTVRAGLASTISEASAYIVEKGLAESGSPILVRLISQISSYFGITVSEKAAVTAIPIIGSAGGAMINTIFIDHFQTMARGHFIIRRLENQYGHAPIKAVYDSL